MPGSVVWTETQCRRHHSPVPTLPHQRLPGELCPGKMSLLPLGRGLRVQAGREPSTPGRPRLPQAARPRRLSRHLPPLPCPPLDQGQQLSHTTCSWAGGLFSPLGLFPSSPSPASTPTPCPSPSLSPCPSCLRPHLRSPLSPSVPTPSCSAAPSPLLLPPTPTSAHLSPPPLPSPSLPSPPRPRPRLHLSPSSPPTAPLSRPPTEARNQQPPRCPVLGTIPEPAPEQQPPEAPGTRIPRTRAGSRVALSPEATWLCAVVPRGDPGSRGQEPSATTLAPRCHRCPRSATAALSWGLREVPGSTLWAGSGRTPHARGALVWDDPLSHQVGWFCTGKGQTVMGLVTARMVAGGTCMWAELLNSKPRLGTCHPQTWATGRATPVLWAYGTIRLKTPP